MIAFQQTASFVQKPCILSMLLVAVAVMPAAAEEKRNLLVKPSTNPSRVDIAPKANRAVSQPAEKKSQRT